MKELHLGAAESFFQGKTRDYAAVLMFFALQSVVDEVKATVCQFYVIGFTGAMGQESFLGSNHE